MLLQTRTTPHLPAVTLLVLLYYLFAPTFPALCSSLFISPSRHPLCFPWQLPSCFPMAASLVLSCGSIPCFYHHGISYALLPWHSSCFPIVASLLLSCGSIPCVSCDSIPHVSHYSIPRVFPSRHRPCFLPWQHSLCFPWQHPSCFPITASLVLSHGSIPCAFPVSTSLVFPIMTSLMLSHCSILVFPMVESVLFPIPAPCRASVLTQG